MQINKIEDQYEYALAEALRLLGSLKVACGTPRKILGLNGWVFEQTVRCAIEEELRKEQIQYEIKEQETIVGKSKVDLLIGNVALEIKVSGFYSNVEDKYSRYRKKLEEKGLVYFYVTLYEEYVPNIEVAQRVFGSNRAFILKHSGEWERFVTELIGSLKMKPNEGLHQMPQNARPR